MKTNVSIKARYLTLALFLLTSTALFAETAVEYYTQGRRYAARLNYYDAAEQFHEALRVNPNYGEAWFALADAEYNLGNYDLCLTYLDAAQKYTRDAAPISVLRAFAFIGQGRLPDAEAMLKKVLAAYPNNIDARFGLAELDLFYGRINAAEQQYLEALRREGTNRRVLLSLALISVELGKLKEAERYVDSAIRYHTDNAVVHYLASYLALERGILDEAEQRARNALSLDSEFDAAYDILALCLYREERYEEAIALCASRTQNAASPTLAAWYIQALALEKLGRVNDAVTVLATAIPRFPNDEILRAYLELLVTSPAVTIGGEATNGETTTVVRVPPEDPRRSGWAAWHNARARAHRDAFQVQRAQIEYRRALRIDPKNREAALGLADLSRSAAPERYLRSLKELDKQGGLPVAVKDRIEGYESRLAGSLSRRWHVDPGTLDKRHGKIGLYYNKDHLQLRHFDAERIVTVTLAGLLNDSDILRAYVGPEAANPLPVPSYGDAFRNARARGYDYFAILSYDENDRELTLTATLYSGRTGTGIERITAHATGNERFKTALLLFNDKICSLIPRYGAILARNGDEVLLDLGTMDGVKTGDELLVLKSGSLKLRDSALGMVYPAADVLAAVTLTRADEDLSAGTLKRPGFYDRVNIGDTVIPAPPAPANTNGAAPSGASAAPPRAPIYEASAEPRPPATVTDVRVGSTIASRLPGLIGLLRTIR